VGHECRKTKLTAHPEGSVNNEEISEEEIENLFQEEAERRATLKGKGREFWSGEGKRDDEQASESADVSVSDGPQKIGDEEFITKRRNDRLLDVGKGAPELLRNATSSFENAKPLI
jgi:hypothetical protein